jgi:cell wall-associated NlpC family hydrolase
MRCTSAPVRVLTVGVLAAALVMSFAGGSAIAATSAGTGPTGHAGHISQSAWGWLTVSGWAYDRDHPNVSSTVDIYANGIRIARVTANHARPDVNAAQHVTGRHGFSWGTRRALVHAVKVYARASVAGPAPALLTTRLLNGYLRPPALGAGARVIARAKQYVGKVPYVSGGTSPTTGFDCSGYAQYVYRVARLPQLPRTAEQQRRSVRTISQSHARPGDLVFYLSGGVAYHEAIYAGNGMQYAAATPQDGIVYQSVWSTGVRYGTNWH